MMSREAAEANRRLTPDEGLKITLQMIDESMPFLLQGTSEEVDRRCELLRR
jgi:hypothetical protein